MKRFTTLLALFVLVGVQLLHAQRVQITGNVTSSEDGSVLPGVSVVVKGTTIGTVTDFEGNYTLAVPEDATTLVFSFIGMITQEISITGATIVDVVLDPDVVGIDEVVVTAIGIKKSAKALGYAVQEIGSEEIENSARTSIIDALGGKVAGVRINRSSGEAGASTFIEIRGSASLTRDNQPLFVVDGVPIDNSANTDDNDVDDVSQSNRAIDLNPDDVETISVLKGGAATALYGIRAANGAIIITTKSGKRSADGKISVNLRSSVTIQNISQMPELQRTYAQGSEIYMGLYDRTGLQMPDEQIYSGVTWGPKISDTRYTTDANYVPGDEYTMGGTTPMDFWIKNWDPNGRLVPADSPYASNKQGIAYDHYDFFQTGTSYKNHIDISGGDLKSTFYLSAAHDRTKGVVPNNDFIKTSVKFKGNTTVAKGLTIGASANYIRSEGQRMQKGSNISGIMLGLLRSPANFDNSFGYQLPDGSQRSYRGGGGYDNPYWTVNNNKYNDAVDRLIGNVNLNWRASEWLSFSYRLGLDKWFKDVDYYFEKGSNQWTDGYLEDDKYSNSDINSDLIASIQKSFGNNLNFGLTVGNNIYQSKWSATQAQANGLESLGFYNMVNTADNRGYEEASMKRTAAFFGDLGLDYASMLYLNLTGRYEWSTTMPVDNNAFFYPSASGGFVFSELPGLKGNSILSFGKIRASIAQIASDAPTYATESYYEQQFVTDGWLNPSGIAFPFFKVNAFTLGNTIGNANLVPERSTDWEVGTDLRFFLGRLNVDFAYFNRVNDNLLLNVPIATSTGFSSRYMNAGKMKTTGLELVLNAVPVRTSSFTWDITVNWSNPTTVVEELAEGVPSITLSGFTSAQVRAKAGDPYRTIYGSKWARDANGNILIDDDPTNAIMDGFPFSAPDMQPMGKVDPEWTAGIMNRFTYKGISLSALLDVKNGGLMWNGTKGAMYYFGTHKDTENRGDEKTWEGVYGHYTLAGDVEHFETPFDETSPVQAGGGGTNATSVVIDEDWYWWSGEGSGFTGPAEDFIEETNWVRLREVSLSYSFPTSIIGNTIANLEVFFSGYNLWLSTPYTGVDPETSLIGNNNGQGIDYFNNPGAKSYTFGIRLGF